MKREDGFYWVKVTPESEWDVMRYCGRWYDTCDYSFDDSELYKIIEQRIKSPDEP